MTSKNFRNAENAGATTTPGAAKLRFKAQGARTFSWQRCYGVLSVSPSNVDAAVSYIKQQDEHHRTMTFEEEFRLFAKRYRVAFDERYFWD